MVCAVPSSVLNSNSFAVRVLVSVLVCVLVLVLVLEVRVCPVNYEC